MGQGTITDDEARKMLEMLKSLFEDELNFPLPGKKLEFEAVGETSGICLLYLSFVERFNQQRST